MFRLKRKSVIYMSISDHEWAQFMSKQIVLAISMQIFDGFYKTSWSRPDTRLNDRLFARILKYVRHAIVWSLKFDMIDRIGRVNSCRESNSGKFLGKERQIRTKPIAKGHIFKPIKNDIQQSILYRERTDPPIF